MGGRRRASPWVCGLKQMEGTAGERSNLLFGWESERAPPDRLMCMSSGGTLYLFYLLPCWVKYQQYCLRSAALAWGPFFDELLFIWVVMCTKEFNSFCKNNHATSTGTSLWLGKFWVQLLNQCAKWQYRQTSTWKQYLIWSRPTLFHYFSFKETYSMSLTASTIKKTNWGKLNTDTCDAPSVTSSTL